MEHAFTGRTRISAAGKFIAYTACNASLTGADPRVEIIADSRSRGVFPLGSQLHFPQGVEHIEIVPIDPVIQLAGTVIIGDDDIRLPIVAGTVSVVDSSVQQTIAGQQFSGGAVRLAGAGLFSCIGIVARNSRRVVVRRMALSGTVGWARMFQAEGLALAPIVNLQAKNKIVNAAPGGSQSRIQVLDSASVSAPDPAPGELINWQQLAQVNTSSNYPLELIERTPYVVDSGFGLFVVAATAAAGLGIYFEFEEIGS